MEFFSVLQNINFCDTEKDQMNYYRNFSKIADHIFSTIHRQSSGGFEDYLIGKKCIIPTFVPPSFIDIKNEFLRENKKGDYDETQKKLLEKDRGKGTGRGSTISLIMEDMKYIKNTNIKKNKNEKYASTIHENKNKNKNKINNMNSNTTDNIKNSVKEQGREQGSATLLLSKKSVSLSDSILFHTPDDVIEKNKNKNVRNKRIDSGAFSVSSAGTDSQIKTPTQTQVDICRRTDGQIQSVIVSIQLFVLISFSSF